MEGVADYLVTVEPKDPAGHAIKAERLCGKSKDYVEGYVQALNDMYSNYNKYIVSYLKV